MKKIFLISILSIFTFGCEDLVSDLNQNPNNPTIAPYQFSLTAAEVANIILQTGAPARQSGIMSGQFTGIDRQHLAYSNYLVNANSFNSTWNLAFRDIFRNVLVTQDSAKEIGIEGVTLGITQVLEAMVIGTATSLFGDIPYDEAGRLEIENPVFEEQMTIYNKIQTVLDEAILNLDTSKNRPPANSEIYFDGNPIAWKQVAFTLKARYYMHVKDYPSAYNAAQNGIGSDGSIDSNDLKSPHGSAVDNANLYYQFFALASRKNDLIVSDFFTSLIDPSASSTPIYNKYRGHSKTDETARYNYLLQKTVVGIQPNFNEGGFAQIDASATMVSYAENLLILAEAGARNSFNSGIQNLNLFRSYMSSGGYLNNPNLSELKYEPFDPLDFENSGIENPDGISSIGALLREILEERYISLFGQIEVFNDVRRTRGNNISRVPVSPNTGSELPQRFLIGSDEVFANKNAPNPIPGFFEPTQVNK